MRDTIFTSLDNCEEIAIHLCLFWGVKVTISTLKEELRQHPNYPSLLSLSDTLRSYGIENYAVKTDWEHLSTLPLPVVIQVIHTKKQMNLFAIIYSIDGDRIEWFNPEKHRKEILSKEIFMHLFTEFVLVAEKKTDVEEIGYPSKRKKELVDKYVNRALTLILPLLLIAICIFRVWDSGIKVSISPIVYTLLSMAGGVVSTLLFMYELDKYNPTLEQICHSGKKTNCNAILSSDMSTVLGISWSSIGFAYFAGTLFYLTTIGWTSTASLNCVFMLSLLSALYIPFSIFYQWKIVKQWCPLCLAVQVVLGIQFIVVIVGRFYVGPSAISELLVNMSVCTICIYLMFSFVHLLIPVLKNEKQGRIYQFVLQRLKNKEEVFNILMSKGKELEFPTDGLGVTVGSSHPVYKLVKVCNPYCSACVKAHPVLEELIRQNPHVQLQIIYSSSSENDDMRIPPIKHLLAIAETQNQLLSQALDNWYLSKGQYYEEFAKMYPMGKDILNRQEEKVAKMRDWCKKEKIEFTPTFFVNGHQLPDIYTVSDLKYLFMI